ncbi:MAG TPA: XrtA/PEP-CTERM system TPR-repeat protein PrsT [Micropepsaceae bacterium]|nr:XrtA/PEP-CTERM system TPR-repeat protein PrsT [Micropepsaceae bacterium]
MGSKNAFPKLAPGAIGKMCLLGMLLVSGSGVAPSEAAAPVANSAEPQSVMNSDTKTLLRDAERAQTGGDLAVALVQLKNAVRLAPRNGEIRARLGMALLKSGDTRTAERELRQAWMDNAPEELVVPPILDTMVVRGEAKELLAEFPDYIPEVRRKIAPEILRARALALQILGRSADANEVMDRSLKLRRDARSLAARAKLAMQQNDAALAQRLLDEAVKLSPTSEDVLNSQIALLYQSGDVKKALAATDQFIKRDPKNIIARVIRIEVLLELKQDDAAQTDLDALLELSPSSSFGPYYRGVLLARKNDFKGAWQEAQALNPEFVLSQPGLAMMVAQIAVASGNLESGGAILSSLVSRRPELTAARIRLAAVQLSRNDARNALRTLEPIKTSDDPQVQALLGQASLRAGRYSDAIGALDKAIGSAPQANTAPLKRQLAESAFELGDSHTAIEKLQELLAHDPGNWDFAVPLIAALEEAGRLEDAIDVANRMAKTSGKIPLPAFYRGRLLGAQGDLVGASAALTEALAVDPKFTPALYFRAHVFAARGNTDAAKKDLQQILMLTPADVYADLALAQIAQHEGKDADALGLIQRAINASPRDPTPRMALASYQMAHRKFADAQATLNKVLEISPHNGQALTQLGQVQYASGDIDRAIETYRGLAATYADSAATYVLLAKALNATKDRLAAIDAARRAVELSPFSTPIRGILIENFIAAGRTDDALASARAFASSHPGPEADSLVASTLVRLKRLPEANTFLTARFAAAPDRILALQLSQIAMSMGDQKKATTVLLDWLKKKPDDFDVRRQYGALLLRTGDKAAARREFESLLSKRPEDPVVLNNLGWIVQDEEPTRAISLVALAAKVAPDATEIMDTLGWLKFKRRDIPGAISILQDAHQRAADDGQIGYHLALVLDANGKRADAKAVLQSALAKDMAFDDRDNAKQLLARW